MNTNKAALAQAVVGIVSLVIGVELCFTGCSSNKNIPTETPHLYWKDIDVIITDIDKQHWYASAHHYKVYITVKSNEYELSESFTLNGSDAKKMLDYDEGDVIKAELFSWVMDSSGDVIRREINKIY